MSRYGCCLCGLSRSVDIMHDTRILFVPNLHPTLQELHSRVALEEGRMRSIRTDEGVESVLVF